MKKLKSYQNQLVNITVKNVIGHLQTISGHIAYVGKDHILFIDQDKSEHPFKRKSIINIVNL